MKCAILHLAQAAVQEGCIIDVQYCGEVDLAGSQDPAAIVKAVEDCVEDMTLMVRKDDHLVFAALVSYHGVEPDERVIDYSIPSEEHNHRAIFDRIDAKMGELI